MVRVVLRSGGRFWTPLRRLRGAQAGRARSRHRRRDPGERKTNDGWTKVTDDPKTLPPIGTLILWFFDGEYRVTWRRAEEDVNDGWLTPPGDTKSVFWQGIEGP